MSQANQPTIHYTLTDEAPFLATQSLLPIVQCFSKPAGIQIQTKDISLAGRILAVFADQLPPHQQVPNDLNELKDICQSPLANIIKLPNVSASIPQLSAAIQELQSQGYAIPNYPENPQTAAEKDIRTRYDSVKGSAVNPVLREGNSDRRAPLAVKNYAKKHPHRMGAWSPTSKSHVSSMSTGDFYASEKSVTIQTPGTFRIEFVSQSGAISTWKSSVTIHAGDLIDAAVLSMSELKQFYATQIQHAKEQDVLFSLHLKATMMKVSDPILFGAAVQVFFEPVFTKYASVFTQLKIDANNGLGALLAKIEGHPQQQNILQDIQQTLQSGPAIAMVNSDKGITNLHVPSDVIVDASMPAMIRDSGKMWNSQGELQDTKAIIPDRCYASVYQTVIEDCKQHGAFDPATMGSVSNVGLMAQKAQEYGSHDKTFQATEAGIVRAITPEGTVLLEQSVQPGDVFRMCQVKDAPIQNWVQLAVTRAKLSQTPAVFWLDPNRAHDRELQQKVQAYLQDHDTSGLQIHIMPPQQATQFSVDRIRQGLDTISVTGNVLRDYLTDLFPILEVGTSAKMLSIVPLMNGGGLFETGAGGSAPKHVQQFAKENYLRWDSLGEFLALAQSYEHLSRAAKVPAAAVLGKTLDKAVDTLLDTDKSPARKLGQIDNRGSHYYLALYWAQELASQTEDSALQDYFKPLAAQLQQAEQTITKELLQVQGSPVDLQGYYKPSTQALQAMRPSETFNAILQSGIL
jgi:isocitrate dehydrogenase